MNRLKYPLELDDSNVDYVIFKSMKYRTNRSVIRVGEGPGVGNAGDDGGDFTGTEIVLYMPTSTPSVANQQGWEKEEFQGPLGELQRDAIATAGSAALDFVDAKGSNIKDFGGAVSDIFSKFKEKYANWETGGAAAGQVLISKVAGAAGRQPGTITALAKGKVYNPNVELIYQAPALRSFSFQYRFVPKDAKEAQQVNKIIKDFKIRSAPDPVDGMFEIPDLWQIQYMVGNSKNKNMNSFKRSALTNVVVVDNNELDMHMSYPEGVPVITSMTLSFQEVDIITRKDHTRPTASNRGY